LAASGVLALGLPAGPALAQAGGQPPVLASPAPLGPPATPRIDVPVPEPTAPISTAPAANQTGVVRRIVVQGNERIESATVLSYLPIEPGETIDPARVDIALKTLFRTDLFSDVRMELSPEGELVVRVVENPILNQVVFEGNKALNDEKLRDEVTVAPRGIFTRSKVQQDVQRILELYRRSGRISATVTPKIVELPQRRVDLIFEISEGPKTGILRINFIGNKAISDNNLRDQVVTKESYWYKFFNSNDNYDPDRIEYDREQLRKYYTNRGYYDFRVVSSVAELSPDQKDFAVTFTLDEGPKYRFGKLNVTTDLKRLNAEVLKALLPIREGQLYESDRIESAVDALTFAAGAAGFAFVDIRPRYTPNRENNTIDVTFDVREGPRVYVERIDIVGNTQTLDHVIRREIRIAEGDAYNRVLVDRSKTEIRRLGFFKTVEFNQQPGSAADRTVLQVQVQEQPTGELSFGAGYSSYDKLLLDIGVSQHNFRGRGQDVRLRASVGSLRQQIDFSFTEPRFRGRDLRFGVDIYSYKYDFSDFSGYNSESTGGGVRFGFPLNIDAYFQTRYTLSHDNVVVAGALCDSQSISSTICDQRGAALTSAVGYTISLDKRNDPIRPTGGFFASLDQTFAGLGGEVKYIQTILNGAVYHGFTPSWILKFEGSAGVIQGWGGAGIRINNRFYKGGNTFRGFEVAGIGPRDTLYDEALGGKMFAIGTVELAVPIPLPEQYGIRAALFSDFGTLGKLDRRYKTSDSIRDDLKLRASAGVSVFWTSPMGPLRLDFSRILSKAPYDRTETFRFSTQTAF
jgi:outer membrane protein insertion porin family